MVKFMTLMLTSRMAHKTFAISRRRLWSSRLVISLILLTPWNTSQFPGVLSFKTNYQQGLVGSYESHRCLEKTLHSEAIGEPVEGIIAVLHVVQNRLKHKDYPETYCKVVLQPKQFSWFNKLNSKYNNQIPLELIKAPLEGSLTEKEELVKGISYQAAVERLGASEIAYTSPRIKLTTELKKVLDSKDVLYYHSVSVKPTWSKRMQEVAQVGQHVFYKK